MGQQHIVIAIDGPAASGKGTLARRLAKHFGFAHMDTGKIYRALGQTLLDNGLDPADPQKAVIHARKLDLTKLDDPRLKLDVAGQAASRVAAIPEVRAALLEVQRQFAAHPPGGQGGAVLDGRDVGTVVCPNADVKFFVTADMDVRARRRTLELQSEGQDVSECDVLSEMKERDERDRKRAVAPLVAASDAHLIDTTGLDNDQAYQKVLDIVMKAVG